MSREHNIERTHQVSQHSRMGKREPVAHPQNCCRECPYGHGRTFCFPCMAQILKEFYENKRADRTDVKNES